MKDKINLPSSGGGIVRYDEDSKSKNAIDPKIVVALIGLVVLIMIALHLIL